MKLKAHPNGLKLAQVLARGKGLVRELRIRLLNEIGVSIPPSVVLIACLDIAAFAAKGIDTDRREFLATAEKIFKETSVPIEAKVGMQDHEAKFMASGNGGEHGPVSDGGAAPAAN